MKKRIAWIAPILAVAAPVTVPAGLATPAPVAAEVSVPEAEAASSPCSEAMGTCYDMDDATCYIWPPPGTGGDPIKQDDACDLNDAGCGPE